MEIEIVDFDRDGRNDIARIDVGAVVNAYTTDHPAADLAAPFRQLTLADIAAFQSSYMDGCP